MIHRSGTVQGSSPSSTSSSGWANGLRGIGVHRRHRRLAGGQMVGMAGIHEVPIALGRLGDDALGPHLADDAADVPAQLHRGLHHAVGVAEEPYVVDADHCGRGALFVLSQCSHLRTRHRAIRSAGVAVGHDAVGHRDAGRGERGNGTGGSEVDVVGMCGHDEDPRHAVVGRPQRDGRSLAQRTLSSARGTHPARSARRGSFENISTIGIRKPRRR